MCPAKRLDLSTTLPAELAVPHVIAPRQGHAEDLSGEGVSRGQVLHRCYPGTTLWPLCTHAYVIAPRSGHAEDLGEEGCLVASMHVARIQCPPIQRASRVGWALGTLVWQSMWHEWCGRVYSYVHT